MRVAAEIGQHLFGAAERRLGVDHPFDPSQFAQAAGEDIGNHEPGKRAEEAEAASLEGGT